MEPREEPEQLYREMTEAATALLDAKPETKAAKSKS